jgi:hypothetical protein
VSLVASFLRSGPERQTCGARSPLHDSSGRVSVNGHNQPVTSVRQISEKLPSAESSIIQK